MIRLDAATVLLQWAAGGLGFLWVTTRRREVGIGYGWLLRSVFGGMAVGAFVAEVALRGNRTVETSALAIAAATAAALAVSVARRKAGVAHARGRAARPPTLTEAGGGPPSRRLEFPPILDTAAPLIAIPGLVAAAVAAGGPHGLAIARTLVGAAFLGVVTDAMLLGHWYLVQPGLSRAPLLELTRAVAFVWPFEIVAFVWPRGMVQVLAGTVDDGWHGLLGWFWVACAAATIVLAVVTRLALKERAYSAVMAATGLLYLAILTAFGTDLVARAILA